MTNDAPEKIWADRGPRGGLMFRETRMPDSIAEYVRADPVTSSRKFKLGDRVTKAKGSSWTGRVVGFYSTSLTPVGYAVESENEPGSVQIYPEAALKDKRGDE